jgi:hypothetical protein
MAADGELYVTLLPCTPADQARIFRTNSSTHQRVKVSKNSRLTAIAQYVLGLVPPSRSQPTSIAFYAKARADLVAVPLCFTVGELFFITNQFRDGEVYYSLIDDPPPPPPPPFVEVEQAASSSCESMPPVFYSGLTLLSNSLGTVLPALNSRGDSFGAKLEEGAAETPINLRNQLEALLAGQSFD